MQALKIEENLRQTLADFGIVICTYSLVSGGEADCISTEYQQEYPTFEIVDVEDRDPEFGF